MRVQREPHRGQLELGAEVQRVGVQEAGLRRDRGAVGVGEARERLGADDLAAGEVHDRLQRDVEALAGDQAPDAPGEPLPARAIGARELLLARRAVALGREVGLDLQLELAQLVGEADEAHDEADGGDRELPGAQRDRWPTRCPCRPRGRTRARAPRRPTARARRSCTSRPTPAGRSPGATRRSRRRPWRRRPPRRAASARSCTRSRASRGRRAACRRNEVQASSSAATSASAVMRGRVGRAPDTASSAAAARPACQTR